MELRKIKGFDLVCNLGIFTLLWVFGWGYGVDGVILHDVLWTFEIYCIDSAERTEISNDEWRDCHV
jgi:hypothetical protein